MKIEKNIPIPSRQQGAPKKHPFKSMNVGDSFFVDNYSRVKMQLITAAGRSYYYKCRTDENLTVTARKEGTGFRVWCVEKAYFDNGRTNT